MMLKMQEAKALALIVMLGMFAGYAGDVENDADDVYMSRENAVNYGILVARTKQQNKLNLDPSATPSSEPGFHCHSYTLGHCPPVSHS